MFLSNSCLIAIQLTILVAISAVNSQVISPNSTMMHSCYACSTIFKKYWLASDPCLRGHMSLPVQQCTMQQHSCVVRTSSKFKRITKITRECVGACRSGCKRYLYGVLKVDCTICCDTNKCNYGNNVERLRISMQHIVSAVIISIINRRML